MATSAYRAAVIGDTPVLYCPLDDDGTGGLLERKTGDLLTAVNAPTAPSAFDDGWTFNGTDEYLEMAAGDTDDVAGWIGATGEFSLECWVRQNNGWSGANVRKIFRWGPYGLFLHVYGFPAQADAYMVAGFYDALAADKVVEEYGAWLDNAWHHVVVTFARPTLNLYIDGNLVQTESRDFDIHITGTGGDSFAIGRDGPFDASYFPGSIDDVAIYNYALTETQIDAHLAASKTETGGDDPTLDDPPGDAPREPPEGIASSFHCGWDSTFGPDDGLVKEMSVDLTVVNHPSLSVEDVYFWAMQADFYGATGLDDPLGGAHVGLQYNPLHPNNHAVNFGGYDEGSVELPGSESDFPSTPDNDNTRDYDWETGVTYSLRIWIPEEGHIMASIDGVEIRELFRDGTEFLYANSVWSEVFARCIDPAVSVRWSNFQVVDSLAQTHVEDTFVLNYQEEAADGCPNTNTAASGLSLVQRTNTTRINQDGAVLVLTEAAASEDGAGVGFIPILGG